MSETWAAYEAQVNGLVCFVDEKKGRSTLVAAIKPKGEIDCKKIQSALKNELPHYMIPKDYIFLESFPLNNNGKTDRMRIREMF